MQTRALRLVAVGRPLELQTVNLGTPLPTDVILRVDAAGLCRSDVHYQSGASYAGPLPLTLGHEVAGTVLEVQADALPILARRGIAVGDRVAVHYLVSCGSCSFCMAGHEQFCLDGQMIGKHRDGGFAEFLRVPARNLVRIPGNVVSEAAAVMMCSTATALHAIHKARMVAGDRVAVFGVGGLGTSAVQLALAMGALEVYAVDLNRERLALAAQLGATPVDATEQDPVEAIRDATSGGVNVSLELLGLPLTIDQAVRSLAPLGRAAIAGISEEAVEIDTYRDLVGREASIVGVSDHTRAEVEYALALAANGALSFGDVITRKLPLQAAAVNEAMGTLAGFGPGVRSVVIPVAT